MSKDFEQLTKESQDRDVLAEIDQSRKEVSQGLGKRTELSVDELKARRYVTIEELREYLGESDLIYGIYYDWRDRTWVLQTVSKWPKDGTDKIEIYHFSNDSLVIFETDLSPETFSRVMLVGNDYIKRYLDNMKEEEGLDDHG